MEWLALHDPHDGQDEIGEEEEGDGPVHGNDDSFGVGDADEEEADGDFGPHEGEEGLDPFSIGVFLEFAEFVGGKTRFAGAEAIVDFEEAEGGADGCTEL